MMTLARVVTWFTTDDVRPGTAPVLPPLSQRVMALANHHPIAADAVLAVAVAGLSVNMLRGGGSRHRARLDEAARDGVPAHITVLYPFLPPAEISERLLARLRDLFAGFGAFEFTPDRVGWFGENVVWLGPFDPAPFSALTTLAFTAFPCCPPYGGQHAEVIPHLTIGHLGGWQALHAAAESVSPCLPVEAAAAEVTLMAGPRPGTPGTPPGLWRTIAAFPLG